MKNMTFALACASTLALFATDFSVATFEAADLLGKTVGAKTDSGATAGEIFWQYKDASGSTDGSAVKNYVAEGKDKPAGTQLSGEVGDQYLDLSTEGGTLWRSFNANADDLGAAKEIPADKEGLFIDTMVQFTATEDGQAPETAEGDKLAIWLAADESGTRLMVKGSTLDANLDTEATSSSVTSYEIANPDVTITAGAWYRLTVKAVKNILNENATAEFIPAFEIYVDGKLMAINDKATGETVSTSAATADFITFYSEDVAASLPDCLGANKAKLVAGTLIPSMAGYSGVDNSALQAVGFKGSGAIDDLKLTDENPIAAPEGGWASDLVAGAGTEENPYKIGSAADFAKFVAGIAKTGDEAEAYPQEGIFFALTDNITLTGTATPVGAGANKDNVSAAAAKDTYIATAFKGTFDGKGFTISGLTLPREDYTGLFGSTYGATIKNLKVECAGFEDNAAVANYGGAILVGTAVDTTIENCEVSGTVTATKAIAGFVGYGASGTVVKDCVNKANLETANEKVAGMIACAQKGSGEFGDVGVTVDGCTNEGNLTCSTSGKTFLGGLVSYADSKVTLKGANEVKGTLTQVGGAASSLVAPNKGSIEVEDGATFTVPAALRTVNQNSVDGIQLGLVTDGVATVTLVKAADVEAGKTYKVMAGTPAPVIALARGESITFNGAIDATGITAADAADQVTVADGVYTCSQIPVPLTGITLSQDTASVECDKTVTLTVTLNPENTTDDKTVTWSVEGDAATVEGGVVTGVKPGTATVTATVAGKTASCAVTVTAIAVTPEVTLSAETAEFSDTLALPTVTVAGDYVKDTDYTVAWDKELPTENPAEDVVLTATVTMTGKYTGSATKTFTVTPKKAAYPTYIGDDPAKQAKYEAWAKTNGADTESAYEVAYLLNVAPAEAKDEAAAFKITSITVDAEGNVTVVAPAKNSKGADFNGTVEVKGAATVDAEEYTLETTDPTAKFFKAILK